MHQGQHAVEIVDLVAAVAESLKADRSAGSLICASLAKACGAEAAAWISVRDGESPEVIGSYPEKDSQGLINAILSAELPEAAAKPILQRFSRVGEVLFLAPSGLPGSEPTVARRVLALAKRRRFGVEDSAMATAAIPALRLMLSQIVEVSERLRRANKRLAAAREIGLTDRELEVLELLAQGLLATSIASRLALSPRTVHKHLGNIYEKMGVHDRLVAVSVAQQRGLVESTR